MLGVDPLHVDPRLVGDAAVGERLHEALVGVLQLDVLADHRDARLDQRRLDPAHHALPARQVDRPWLEAEELDDDLVETLPMEDQRHLVDRLDVLRRDDGLLLDVAEEGDLRLDARRQVAIGATEQHVGLDSDRPQLLDRVLRGLRLQLGGRLHVRHEGEVHVDDVLAPDVLPELPDRLEEREPLDVADGAADLDDDHIGVAGDFSDGRLDLVGDVGNHLDRPSEIVAAALLLDDRVVDLAGRHVVIARHPAQREPLVVAQVQIGLAAVVGHEDLAVLVRAHGPRVHVDVRIHLLQRHAEAA